MSLEKKPEDLEKVEQPSMTSLTIICKQPENFALASIPKYSSGIVLKDAINNGVQISKMKRDNKTELSQILFLLIMDIKNWFKTIRGLQSKEEIFQVITIIVRRFYYLKVEEIAFAFNNAKSGQYIKILDRFDGGSIIEILTAYENNDRAMYLSDTHIAYNGAGTSEIAKTIERQMEERKKFDSKKFYEDGIKEQDEKERKEKQEKAEQKKRMDEVRNKWIEDKKNKENK